MIFRGMSRDGESLSECRKDRARGAVRKTWFLKSGDLFTTEDTEVHRENQIQGEGVVPVKAVKANLPQRGQLEAAPPVFA